MGSKPKIPDPVPPPAPPPPPAPMAEKAENVNLKKRNTAAAQRKLGTSSLTVRRSSIGTGSAGSGANVNY
jgi:hypothetical protein